MRYKDLQELVPFLIKTANLVEIGHYRLNENFMFYMTSTAREFERDINALSVLMRGVIDRENITGQIIEYAGMVERIKAKHGHIDGIIEFAETTTRAIETWLRRVKRVSKKHTFSH